jgi:hypothetical protein
MEFSGDRAGKLMRAVASNPEARSAGVMMNDLLAEFHRGYPVTNLRELLRSPNERLVIIGAWLASELGAKGRPLLGDIRALLHHRERKVRFSALDCVLAWAEPVNGTELASAVTLVEDTDPGVRWKALDFLSRTTIEQLRGALSYIKGNVPQSPHIRGLDWLLSGGASACNGIVTMLQSPDALMRKYAVVGARKAAATDLQPLQYAASTDDPDVKEFARTSLSLL